MTIRFPDPASRLGRLKPAATRYVQVLTDYGIALAMARSTGVPPERKATFTARALDCAALAAALEMLATRQSTRKAFMHEHLGEPFSIDPEGLPFVVATIDCAGHRKPIPPMPLNEWRDKHDERFDTPDILPGEKLRAGVDPRSQSAYVEHMLRTDREIAQSFGIQPDKPWPRE